MKKLFLLPILMLMLCSSACRKHSSSSGAKYDYMIFGVYYGECMGKCATFYRLKDGQLTKDTSITYANVISVRNDTLNHSLPPFHFDYPLPNDKYALVQDLPSAVPTQLYNENYKIFGQPDAADQGAIDVYMSLNGKAYKWTFDTYKQNDPAYQAAFIDRLAKAFQDLR